MDDKKSIQELENKILDDLVNFHNMEASMHNYAGACAIDRCLYVVQEHFKEYKQK